MRTKVRSLAIRRHRMFGAGVSSMAVLALVLSLVLLPSGSASPQQANSTPAKIFISDRIGNAYELSADEPRPSPAPPAVAKAVEQAEVGFSLKLLNELAASSDSNGSTNELVSPSSLATALAMLELGAGGSTEQGIASALQSGGLSAREQAEGWYSLAALLAGETSTSSGKLTRSPSSTSQTRSGSSRTSPSCRVSYGRWKASFRPECGRSISRRTSKLRSTPSTNGRASTPKAL